MYKDPSGYALTPADVAFSIGINLAWFIVSKYVIYHDWGWHNYDTYNLIAAIVVGLIGWWVNGYIKELAIQFAWGVFTNVKALLISYAWNGLPRNKWDVAWQLLGCFGTAIPYAILKR